MGFMKSARLAFLGVALALFSCRLAAGEPPADLAALRTKADRGDRTAQYQLGLALTRSATTPAERIEAFVWLTLASEGGASDKTLETVLDTLNPTQAIEVRRRVEAVRAANPALRPAAVPIIATPAAGGTPIIRVPGDDKALQDLLATALKDKSQLAAELTAAWKELEQLKAQLALHADSSTTIITAQKTLRETQANLARQSSELATARAEAAAIRIEIGKLQTQLTTARAQLTTSNDAKAKTEIALAAAEQAAVARAEDLGKVRAASSAQELATVRDRATATRELEARVRQLETEKAAFTAAEQAAVARAEDLGKVRAAANAQELATVRDRATATRELEARVRQLETEKAALTAAQQAAVARAEDLGKLHAAATAQELATVRDRATATRELEARVRQLETEKAALTAAQQAAVARAEDLGKLRAAASAQELATVNDRATATRELEARVRQLETEKAVLAAASAANPGVTPEELARATKAVTEAEGKLATSLRSYTLLTTERDQLRGQITDLRAKLSAAEARATPLSNPAQPTAPVTTAASIPVVTSSPPPVGDAAPTRPTAPSGAAGHTHVIAIGDTLSNISRRYYGTPNRWTEILAANRDVLTDERSLIAGKVLRIP